MHYGVWLLIFLRKEQMQMKLVFRNEFDVTLKGAVSHRVEISPDWTMPLPASLSA